MKVRRLTFGAVIVIGLLAGLIAAPVAAADNGAGFPGNSFFVNAPPGGLGSPAVGGNENATTAGGDANAAAGPSTTALGRFGSGLFFTSGVFDLPLTENLIARAEPDECFAGIGLNGDPATSPTPPNCPAGSIPKVNGSYVWGMTQNGNDIWFGTVANTECLAAAGYFGGSRATQTDNIQVCEYRQSWYARNHITSNKMGDWRLPHIYYYDTGAKQLHDVTPSDTTYLAKTMGIRSAGSIGDVVFMAGPTLDSSGINIMAFRASTHEYLGGTKLTDYDNIRKWIVYNNVLYTAVRNSQSKNGGIGGAVLRWTGTLTSDPVNLGQLFQFEEVAHLDGEGAELAVHQGRLFVDTWPDAQLTVVAGLWMSPLVDSSTGLTAADADNWSKVWSVDQYEPDPIIARTYGMGPLISYGGSLYFSTMHVPLTTFAAIVQYYDIDTRQMDAQQALEFINKSQRATIMLRGSNFGTRLQRVQLLYGESQLAAYNPSTGWTNQATKAGWPLYGSSGYGNKYNGYTWSMAIYNNQLFIGTMDDTIFYSDMIRGILSNQFDLSLPRDFRPLLGNQLGYDLYRIRTPFTPAETVTINGFGNPASYGIRSMLSTPGGLYLGTANPNNLMTDPNNPKGVGGWEFIVVK